MKRLWHRTDEHVHRHWDISHRSGVCSLWADEAHLVMSSHQWLTITNSYKQNRSIIAKHQSPVVQNTVSLTSSLVVKMLTVLVSRISNSQVFLLKNVSSFCKCKSYSHFFSKNINVYAIFNNQSFNDTLTNNIVSFEQMGLFFSRVQQMHFVIMILV